MHTVVQYRALTQVISLRLVYPASAARLFRTLSLSLPCILLFFTTATTADTTKSSET